MASPENKEIEVMARQAKIPQEVVLSVMDGAPCYKGLATAINIGGSDVIIIAKNIDQLKAAFVQVYNTVFDDDVKRRVLPELCHPVVVLAVKHVTL